ncbi:hypothetical protein CW751_08260 [Brumimicrobium salinarum]|uniref:Uncharacterized protein n=1 Tax=Brumimicrobium salinarum TaxID=2058658 RepID=A0A2I0R2E4_9FLAO|nr:hypothetical protein CW751_08260 [Brumimicrobium salinarum]
MVPYLCRSQQYQSDKGHSKYRTYDQLVSLLFGQLNKCHTLEDISIRICLPFYLSLDYVMNNIKPIAQKAEKPPPKPDLWKSTQLNLF